jgi:ADP-ribose pyrophosphatase YjhB (NUDIX family)
MILYANHADWAKTLPTARIGAGAIFLNEQDEVLLVKPSYRDYWLLPGGVVEQGEAPQAAAVREVREEIGVMLNNPPLVAVAHSPQPDGKGEIQFFFYGGKLADASTAVKIDYDEIGEARFFPLEQALALAGQKLAARLPECLKAIAENRVAYIEDQAGW